jgi:hypothetical protein
MLNFYLTDLMKFCFSAGITILSLWLVRKSAHPFLIFFVLNFVLLLGLIKFFRSDAFKNLSLIIVGLTISLTVTETSFILSEMYHSTNNQPINSAPPANEQPTTPDDSASPSFPPTKTGIKSGKSESTCKPRPDPDLGYRGGKGPLTCRVKNVSNNQVIYDITYNINENGFRITPDANSSGESIVFFGGSYTLGEGVKGNETFPYFVLKNLDYRFNIVNMGWHGWGPHQMLRLIESEILKKAVQGKIHAAIYQTVIWHATRSAGNAQWDKYGPKYIQTHNGEIQSVGPFTNKQKYMYFADALKKSRLFRWILERPSQITEEDMEIYIAIILKTSSLLQKNFGIPLTILYWDSDADPSQYAGYSNDRVIDMLRDNGLTVLRVSDVLNWEDPKMKIEGDGHPSALAHALNGKMVANFILKNQDSPRLISEDKEG